MEKLKLRISEESKVVSAGLRELELFLEYPEFSALPNKEQLLLMEKYDLSAAYNLLLSDLSNLKLFQK